jgi:hypothetical protein
MFILTILGKETDGAYSVANKDGTDILYIFQEEDDASRYAMMLENSGSPEMHVIEVDNETMIETCVLHNYSYTLITPNDIVIPPDTEHDLI